MWTNLKSRLSGKETLTTKKALQTVGVWAKKRTGDPKFQSDLNTYKQNPQSLRPGQKKVLTAVAQAILTFDGDNLDALKNSARGFLEATGKLKDAPESPQQVHRDTAATSANIRATQAETSETPAPATTQPGATSSEPAVASSTTTASSESVEVAAAPAPKEHTAVEKYAASPTSENFLAAITEKTVTIVDNLSKNGVGNDSASREAKKDNEAIAQCFDKMLTQIKDHIEGRSRKNREVNTSDLESIIRKAVYSFDFPVVPQWKGTNIKAYKDQGVGKAFELVTDRKKLVTHLTKNLDNLHKQPSTPRAQEITSAATAPEPAAALTSEGPSAATTGYTSIFGGGGASSLSLGSDGASTKPLSEASKQTLQKYSAEGGERLTPDKIFTDTALKEAVLELAENKQMDVNVFLLAYEAAGASTTDEKREELLQQLAKLSGDNISGSVKDALEAFSNDKYNGSLEDLASMAMGDQMQAWGDFVQVITGKQYE